MKENILLENESDVEQKFLFPLFTYDNPTGLGFNPACVKTKSNIKKYKIDKGKKEKYYFPDYVIISNGLPFIIVEAKDPDEELNQGFREARLYASEINASYPKDINPAQLIICSNGNETIAGSWDSDEASFGFKIDECDPTNINFSDFIDSFSSIVVEKLSIDIKSTIRSGTKFYKPTYLLGGRVSRSQELGENSFGTNLALDYQYLFNPDQNIDRDKIVQNAYVESRRRLSHVDPIDRLIRSIVTPSKNASTEFHDTSDPKELLNRFDDHSKLRNQVCLLVGSVGSGKSTFIDFVQNKALSEETLKKTSWIRLNLNKAPLDSKLIYEWLIDQTINEISILNSSEDFSDFEFIKKVFWREIKQIKKGAISLLKNDEKVYNLELFKEITKLMNDKSLYLKRIIHHLYSSKSILPIITLDNCDKRNRDCKLPSKPNCLKVE
jgi:hypothetical protein